MVGNDRKKRTAWHNKLPAWILDDDGYRSLGQGPAKTLQAIANRCDRPRNKKVNSHHSGVLLPCFGGQSLYDDALCSARTFWRHLPILIGSGYVIELSRGGSENANVYGIPSQRGELDDFAASKTGHRGQWTKNDSNRVRTALAERNLAKLQDQHRRQTGMAPVTECHGGSDKMSWGLCQTDALPSHIPSHSTKAYTNDNNRDVLVGNEAQVDDGPVVMTFATLGDPPQWHLRQSRLDRYRKAFPAEDVAYLCKKAMLWLEDHPNKRVETADMLSWLTRWITTGIENGWTKKSPQAIDNLPDELKPHRPSAEQLQKIAELMAQQRNESIPDPNAAPGGPGKEFVHA
jgi:hypothetical protein